MDNGFFCKQCGMVKARCVCPKGNTETTKKPETSRNMTPEIKKLYPDVEDEIIENFPFSSPRKGQFEIISRINDAMDDGYKYIILEAGTGTGKSAIATTLANIYQPAYILTMTKQLQSQYSQEFGYPMVKGRANFNCKDAGLEATCDMGTCQTIPSSQKFVCEYGITKSPFDDGSSAFMDAYGSPIYFRSGDACNYWRQKARAVESPITLMNYDYALLELAYVKHFGKRQLMVLDEAHNIEDKLMRRLEVNIFNNSLRKDIKTTIPRNMMGYEDPKEWTLFIQAIYQDYKDLNVKELPKNKADRINRTKLRLSELMSNLEEHPDNWVVDTTPGGASFKPLKIDVYAQERLFQYADVCLFMSATILDHELFCRWLGIDPEEVYYLRINSSFPASSRPVHIKSVGPMSQRAIRRTAPKTIPILEKIIEHHKYEKGLIHTHNYKCQQYIMKHIKNPRLMDHDSKNREYKLHEFERSKEPKVFVSPSMSEGVDLPYEKCQFQVIYKVPFPYLGDKQINKRKAKDPKWYAYKTVMTLLQAYGRGMRAEDDYCETYVLDGNIKMLFRNRLYKSLVPEFFTEAISKD
ncbi:helicase C-terminal domain-containing protein [Methanobacterium paludis]|uniref:Helicase c2 n=1 Tax=Methanobacterium paludis (strain DSM 25820 / JCM 18151 / SWAN1) TaxID=868131 RepID=F6D5Z3_METPW|nr:ATP-dependent DNA helicase [Methanobacterium paludis]AEG19363.1 helicase c2 [Methanobacterium paludis]